MVVMMAGALVACAQSVNDQMAKIDELCAKLYNALDKAPKPTNEADVDAFVDGCKNSAVGATTSAVQLQDFYKRQIGETVDGVTDVTITKPTLEEWVELGAKIATQATGAAELGVSSAKATKAVKESKGMKAMSLAKPVKWGTDIMPVISEALVEEGKAVNQIIETLKTGDNL